MLGDGDITVIVEPYKIHATIFPYIYIYTIHTKYMQEAVLHDLSRDRGVMRDLMRKALAERYPAIQWARPLDDYKSSIQILTPGYASVQNALNMSS